MLLFQQGVCWLGEACTLLGFGHRHSRPAHQHMVKRSQKLHWLIASLQNMEVRGSSG